MPLRASEGASGKASRDLPKQRITTPILLQMHASECGAACLGSVLAYFGRWVPLTELREKCEVSRDGSSAASISRAARHYGLECNGLSIRAEQLRKLRLPLILFWQFSHFVVLEGFDERHFYLNDPATGRRRVSAEEFNKGYSGIALRFRRGEDFTTGGERPSLFAQLKTLPVGSWTVLTGVFACGLMLTLLTLIVPASLSVFVDDVLEHHGPWGGLVAALLLGGVLVYVLSLLKHRFLKRLAVPGFGDRLRPGPVAAAAFAGRVFRTPAGRRSDRPGVVHRQDREEPDRPVPRAHYRHGDERGVAGRDVGI